MLRQYFYRLHHPPLEKNSTTTQSLRDVPQYRKRCTSSNLEIEIVFYFTTTAFNECEQKMTKNTKSQSAPSKNKPCDDHNFLRKLSLKSPDKSENRPRHRQNILYTAPITALVAKTLNKNDSKAADITGETVR